MKPLRLAIHGAAGRMGQRLVAVAAADPQWQIVAALESPGHPKLGQDAGLAAGAGEIGVSLADKIEAAADVVVDFSVPAGALAITRVCRQMRLPLVLATTGLEPKDLAEIDAAAADIPLLRAPSMSLAVNLCMKLAAVAAAALADHPGGADVEIIEKHHRYKEDAPSGTALKFGEIISRLMRQSTAQHGRHGRPGARPHGEIGYHAVRMGDNPGEHGIIFGLLGETLELGVKATSRDCYVHGALTAAQFLAGKPSGRYGMNDVLGI